MAIRIFENNKLQTTYKNDDDFIRSTQTTWFNEWECNSDLWKKQLQFTKFPTTLEQCKHFLETYCDKQVKFPQRYSLTIKFTLELDEKNDLMLFEEELGNAFTVDTKLIDYDIDYDSFHKIGE